jgi:predicted DNA-binding transcriptional regulator AlpA
MRGEIVISPAVLDRVITKVLERVAKPKYLTLRQAAKHTGLSEKTIERAIRSGDVERNKKPARLLVIRESLEAWIEGREA